MHNVRESKKSWGYYPAIALAAFAVGYFVGKPTPNESPEREAPKDLVGRYAFHAYANAVMLVDTATGDLAILKEGKWQQIDGPDAAFWKTIAKEAARSTNQSERPSSAEPNK